jgi:hypothetical protein
LWFTSSLPMLPFFEIHTYVVLQMKERKLEVPP